MRLCRASLCSLPDIAIKKTAPLLPFPCANYTVLLRLRSLPKQTYYASLITVACVRVRGCGPDRLHEAYPASHPPSQVQVT